jgi:hydroxypyruvate isomerase
MKISVCIEMLLTEYSFPERIKKVAELGFPAVEFWFWDTPEKGLPAIEKIVKETRIEVSDIVVNSPDGKIGGSLVAPADRKFYLKRLENTIAVAQRLRCQKLITCAGDLLPRISLREHTENMIDALSEAVKMVESEGMMLLLEPLNTLVDHAGYFLNFSGPGFDVVRRIKNPHLRLLYDIYHMQIMEGNIINTVEKNIDLIGHFHLAGVPGRHELWLGELNYPAIIKKIDDLGYAGFFGLEYSPTLSSVESLRQFQKRFS